MPATISSAPGAYATTITVNPTYDASLATDQLFGAGVFERGPVNTVTTILTERNLERTFGTRIGSSVAYDSCRAFLSAGRALRLTRVVGPAAVTATATLINSDATPAEVLAVDAVDPGEWGNALTVAVIAGSEDPAAIVLIISDATGELERSPEVTTQAAAVAWGAVARHVRIRVLAAPGLPALSVVEPLLSGTADLAAITDDQRQTAVDLFDDTRLGPGQITLFGATSAGAYEILQTHADLHDHHALLDLQDVDNEATLIASVSLLHTTDGAARSSAYWPWGRLDGFPVCPSAAVAAAMARSDLATRGDDGVANPNQAAAGENGRLAGIIDSLTQDADEQTRANLNDVGINVLWDVTGQGDLQVYGFRTLTDPVDDPINLLVPNVRLDMLIRAQARQIGRRFNFQQIDGQKHTAARFGAELVVMMRDHYHKDALFGATEAEAFNVDTLDVNNRETAAALQLLGTIKAVRSPGAEQTLIEIYNYGVLEGFPS